ncbi:MAG: protein kinase [Planctomycetes bacterium]|nr:protein kinase [Planctomycetota bacterium]
MDGTSPEDYRRATELFHEVYDLAPAERERVLRERAPSAAVRAEVEFLLGEASHDGFGEDDLGALNQVLLDAVASEPVCIGPYRIVRRIGAGGMGVVYEAEQRSPRRSVAIKVLRGPALDAAEASRFAREAELLGRLQHPGIAQIYESGTMTLEQGGGTYIAMELVAGGSIRDHVETRRLGPGARVRLLAELGRAVHHAHLRGVLHRDLKPSNVLVTADGRVKVIDFGVARPLEGELEFTTATRTGQLVGTVAYMSPEQVRGDIARVDARTDVYALGVLAYEVLGGQPPHAVKGLPLTAIARLVDEREPRRLGAVAPECRGDLELIVAKAMAKEPERRYQSAAAFADDLDRYLEHRPIEARPTSVGYQVRRFTRRHRAVVASALTALLAILGGAIVALWFALDNAELAAKEKAARQQADDRALEVTRRADRGRLLLARQAAAELWPALPELEPAIERWLRRHAEPLRANLPLHERYLAELRSQALPYSDADRQRDLETHPARPELDAARERLAGLRRELAGTAPGIPQLAGADADRTREAIEVNEREVAALEQRLSERQSWTFADAELQEEHDHMTRLVADLRAFFAADGDYESVLTRQRFARSIVERTVTGPEAAAAWRRASADIAALPEYHGLELEPQVGLLPLRRDPQSGLWEFWHVASGERPEPDVAGDADAPWSIRTATGVVLVLLPGGAAWLGAQAEDPAAPNYHPMAHAGEGPVRQLEFPPLLVSKYEMTQAQWFALTKAMPSAYGPTFRFYGKPPRSEPITANTTWNPVENVSCRDAITTLARVDLTLPTVLEWEYAARGGVGLPWWPGGDVQSLLGTCNLADGAVRDLGGPLDWRYEPELEDRWVVHAPVGTFAANPFGLHDTIGNVWEWCIDEPQAGFAVACGGSFSNPAALATVTVKNFQQRDTRSETIGLRPVREVR